MDESKIPNSLLPHLNEIAERLWSGHAAIMVGAGFSRNANAIDDNAKGFPDWNGLGELFYEKARGEKITRERFLNPLKLADEVEASFDRPTLHKLLIDSIPDKDYEPSELHVKLLNLPWSDVFTTNYDTLLERATKSVSDYSYQTVVNAEGLVYSKSSRIIKLHGSFPDAKPFIITEEDYRRYPTDFAPFVNTVQQSLLENTLILIGFSGDDPNFLRWIGWIRDNLGKGGSPKIYMVGILNLTKAQELLFLRNNIIPIDMSELDAVGKNEYFRALDEFLNYCLCKKAETDRLDWPRSEGYKSPKALTYQETTDGTKGSLKHKNTQVAKEQAEQVALHWREERGQYPGWVVVPEDRRTALWESTKHWDGYPKLSEDFSPISRIFFLFEYFWRTDKCLLPVFDDQVDAIKIVISDFYPIISENESYPESMVAEIKYLNFEYEDVREMLSFLTLTLLRFFREEGRIDEWEALYNNSKYIVSTSEDKAKRSYEYSLFCIFKSDIERLEVALNSWDSIGLTPYWLAKKAGLVAEFGDMAKAVDMLEEALSEVRSKQNLNPVISDYSLVSQESFILVLLKYISQGKSWADGNYRKSTDYSDRWNQLKQYKCDPWTELKLLQRSVEGNSISMKSDDEDCQFDIGYRSNTISLSPFEESTFQAFRLLRFYEDVGIPHRIPGFYFSKKALTGVCKLLYEYSPYWVLSTMLRTGDKDLASFIFSRRYLMSMASDDIDSLSKNYLEIYRKMSLKGGAKNPNYKNILDHSMLEVLSRLCTKASIKIRMDMLDTLLELYRSKLSGRVVGVDKLVRRLVGGFSWNEFVVALPIIIDFPVYDEDEYIAKHMCVNPFKFTSHLNPEYLVDTHNINIASSKVSKLVKYVSIGLPGERRWAIDSLQVLKRLKLLNENQISSFIEVLWQRTDDYGFPTDTNYCKFALCNDLAVDKGKSHLLIKSYILNTDLPIQAAQTDPGITITGVGYDLCHEISGSSEYLSWGESEIYLIISKLADCWELDKKYLSRSRGSSVANEFRKRFRSMQNAIVFLIYHHFRKFSEEIVALTGSILDEMSSVGLSCVRFRIAYSILVSDGFEIFECLRSGFLSTDEDDINDAVNTIYDFLYKRLEVSDDDVTLALGLVKSALLYRDEKRLVHSIWVAKRVIDDCSEYLTDDLKESVLFCLDKLTVETSNAESSFSYPAALAIREAAASLAYSLYRYFDGHEGKIPTVLDQWKSICASEDEFSDIRKQWIF